MFFKKNTNIQIINFKISNTLIYGEILRVRQAGAAGLKLRAWVPNDSESFGRLERLGVEAITTDRPDLLLAFRSAEETNGDTVYTPKNGKKIPRRISPRRKSPTTVVMTEIMASTVRAKSSFKEIILALLEQYCWSTVLVQGARDAHGAVHAPPYAISFIGVLSIKRDNSGALYCDGIQWEQAIFCRQKNPLVRDIGAQAESEPSLGACAEKV